MSTASPKRLGIVVDRMISISNSRVDSRDDCQLTQCVILAARLLWTCVEVIDVFLESSIVDHSDVLGWNRPEVLLDLAGLLRLDRRLLVQVEDVEQQLDGIELVE